MSRRLSFVADWFQEEASISKSYIVWYYVDGNAIEVFDPKAKKMFLRRTKMPELSEKDFFVGSKINIFGRQFDIVDYGDEVTKSTLAKHRKKTFILLKHTIMQHLGAVLAALIESNFSINKASMVQFTGEQAKKFLNDSQGDGQSSVLMKQLLSGPSIGLELIADNALEKIKYCTSQAKESMNEDNIPHSLRSLFNREEIRNGIYCSQSEEQVARDVGFFFENNNGLQTTVELKNSTLCIIKPHAIKEGNLGKIISEITTNDFKITALKMHLLDRVNCAEFYEVYRGILPEYVSMVSQLSSGACVALEVVCNDPNKNSYEDFRKFCGPMDPEIAKLLRPHTLRAKFGAGKTLNAVHCTDLPDDTVLELEYFFKILN
ncbi:nucleoside diphosphate kinase 7 [Stomoxys calcitrans]|uniref:DM10 domain-containing protein n=1 Tax=Stomoxys calcitrans TaxID=35570 RepID=A0A1I8NS34_STOCA|nr:nucleoside diphosphate kinase 7 [Stomoxys calcitrans]